VTLVGSRCGRFSEALRFLEGHSAPLARMVTAEYPLDRALEAFEHSGRPEALKVLLTTE
jgi:threonine dehydrogenase-like Zn-dependent dehydrogenase